MILNLLFSYYFCCSTHRFLNSITELPSQIPKECDYRHPMLEQFVQYVFNNTFDKRLVNLWLFVTFLSLMWVITVTFYRRN